MGSHRRRRHQPLTAVARRLMAAGFTNREATTLLAASPRHIRWLREAGYSWARARRAVYNPSTSLVLVSNGRTIQSWSMLELLSAHCSYRRKR